MTFIRYSPPETEQGRIAEAADRIRSGIAKGRTFYSYEKLSRNLERWPGNPDLLQLATDWRVAAHREATRLGSDKAMEMSAASTEADALFRLLDRLLAASEVSSTYPRHLLPSPD